MRKLLLMSLLCALAGINLKAQQKFSVSQYIETYKWIAIEEMHRTGIPASIKMAQGILESGFGNSDLAMEANNHFGIKCHKGWEGPTFHKDDDAKDECFRKYADPDQSFRDHSEFIKSRERYAFLFQLDPRDYKAWANGLKQAGYATNPQYPQLLIKTIEDNKLFELDKVGPMETEKEISKAKNPIAQNQNNGTVSSSNQSGKSEFGLIPMPGPREIFINNRVKYIVARRGDTIEKLAEEMGMAKWQFISYNELELSKGSIKEDQVLYIQPKRRKAKVPYHIVQPGENVYSISQVYAVKTKHIYKLNKMIPGEEPSVGQKLILR